MLALRTVTVSGLVDRAIRLYGRVERAIVGWFDGRPPYVRYTLPLFLLVSVVVFIRYPDTNYIFDEQEALLANPYVNAAQDLTFTDVIHRDFWGLPPNASIGSYRPLPNVIWRLTWHVSKHPFVHHLYNLLFHAINASLLASFAFAVSQRKLLGWLAGASFLVAGVLTEAVSGIVGIADVLGGLGAVLALSALRLPAGSMGPGVFLAMLVGMFSKESALVCVPLVPVAAVLCAPHLHPERPARLARGLIALIAAAGAFVLYVELRRIWFPSPLPSALQEPLPVDAHWLASLRHDFLVWFHQAPLPNDPLNNPLVKADTPHRIAGALRVYFRGILQVLMPLKLAGDYSFPQEPIPDELYGWETVAGGTLMVGPLLLGLGLWITALVREARDRRRAVPTGAFADALDAIAAGGGSTRLSGALVEVPRREWSKLRLGAGVLLLAAGGASMAVARSMVAHPVHAEGDPALPWWPAMSAMVAAGLGLVVQGWRGPKKPAAMVGPWPWRHIAPLLLALGMVWMVVSYFPHSNIPVVLPTVRAERFWYFPVIGTSLMLGVGLAYLHERLRGAELWKLDLATFAVVAFLFVQAMQAYRHAGDYRNDLEFWRATKNVVTRSAKAHLNYSVMVGARGDLETRLYESRIAAELAPDWPMAHVYTGDTLCRMNRAPEAWPHYARGFALGPNDQSLIALALQCLHDEQELLAHEAELRRLAADHPGSWLAYLATDTLDNHLTHGGVDPQYRPRGYNEGVD